MEKKYLIISTNLREDGVLEIYHGDELMCCVSEGKQDEGFVEDILYGLGYQWNEDGTITQIIEVDCNSENNSKPELSLERSLELLTSIIDHVSAGNNCSGTIKKLLQMGFTGEELHSVFNFNLHDVADVEDEIESESEDEFPNQNQII